MAQLGLYAMVRAGLVVGVALVWPLEVAARGAGVGGGSLGGGSPGGGGFEGRGVHAAGGYGSGASIRFGAGNRFQNRAGLGRSGAGRVGFGGVGRSYYPNGGFGAAGYYPAGPVAPFAAGYDPADAVPNSITTRAVIIHRGPAFGEPGYVSHPAIYRLTQAESRRPGTRRFKVERLDF